jgi:hypothetical protein
MIDIPAEGKVDDRGDDRQTRAWSMVALGYSSWNEDGGWLERRPARDVDGSGVPVLPGDDGVDYGVDFFLCDKTREKGSGDAQEHDD